MAGLGVRSQASAVRGCRYASQGRELALGRASVVPSALPRRQSPRFPYPSFLLFARMLSAVAHAWTLGMSVCRPARCFSPESGPGLCADFARKRGRALRARPLSIARYLRGRSVFPARVILPGPGWGAAFCGRAWLRRAAPMPLNELRWRCGAVPAAAQAFSRGALRPVPYGAKHNRQALKSAGATCAALTAKGTAEPCRFLM